MFDLNSTDWNKHGQRVGATLLGNWVEERAVGDEVKKERGIDNISQLSRNGHQGLLTQDRGSRKLVTTTQEQTSAINNAKPLVTIGKRRALIEAELLKRAIAEAKKPDNDRTTEWTTTVRQDYGHAPKQEIVLPPEELIKKYSNPITFWNDQARLGNVYMCSTDVEQLKQEKTEERISFRKHTQFSTPIDVRLK